MPRYEFEDVHISSFGTSGSTESETELGLTGAKDDGETQGELTIDYTEIKVKYPPLDPAAGDTNTEDTFVFRDNDADDPETQRAVELVEATVGGIRTEHVGTAFESAVLDFALTGSDEFLEEEAVLDFALTGDFIL